MEILSFCRSVVLSFCRSKHQQGCLRAVLFFIFISPSIVLALSDYRPVQEGEYVRYYLPDDTEVGYIEIKFHDRHAFRLRDDRLRVTPKPPQKYVVPNSVNLDLTSIATLIDEHELILRPLFTDPQGRSMEAENDAKKFQGEIRSGKTLADLNNFYALHFDKPRMFGEVKEIVTQLNLLSSIEVAYATPRSEEPIAYDLTMPPYYNPPHTYGSAVIPSSSTQGSQGYLSSTNNGVHAVAGWHWPGGIGENVKFVDVEYAINIYHEDLPSWFHVIWWSSQQGTNSSHHGTAVVGVLSAMDNHFGITGISHEAQWGFHSTRYCFITCWYQTHSAINLAADQLDEGDVILIEVHVPGPTNNGTCAQNPGQCDYVPAEWYTSTFAATQTAVANGIVVLAAAGNGQVGLDNSVYNGYWDINIQDSGAILVGAVEPDESEGVSYFSNYGSRVTARGWGNQVATLGKHDETTGYDHVYRHDFSGTSSATPIVAGAVINIQSAIKAMGKSPLSSQDMRTLISQTGTPQTYDTAKHIGEMPNIHAAITELQQDVISCHLSGTGSAQHGGFQYHNVQVENIGTVTLDGWTLTLDFNGAIPSVGWLTSNAAYHIYNDKIIISGDSLLAPSSSVYFSLNGTYSGPSSINVSCL